MRPLLPERLNCLPRLEGQGVVSYIDDSGASGASGDRNRSGMVTLATTQMTMPWRRGGEPGDLAYRS